MKRPVATVTLVYGFGLIAGDVVPLPPDIMLPLAFAFVLLMLVALVRGAPRYAEFFLWPLLLLTGWANFSCQTSAISPYDLRNLNLRSSELVTLRGVLNETPSQRVYVRDEKESYRFLANIRVTELRGDSGPWRPGQGLVLVLTPGLLPSEFFGGRSVEVTGVLSQPPGPSAQGLFDYAAYLRQHSIYYQLKTDGTNDWGLIADGRSRPFCDRFLTWAQSALSEGLADRDEPLQMLWAMTLGWKTVNNEIYEPFMKSGTMHIFAISGLHIALIAGIFVALLRVLQLPRPWCGLIVVPLIWFYTAATGWQPSAIRSTIMMSIIIGGWALSRPTDLLNSLALSAFIILLWDPQQLFGASFQLSFFVVLSIGLLLPLFEQARDRLLRTDPLLPRELVPRWKRTMLVPLRWVTTSLAISLASWLGSLPLTAYYFHLFSPVTLVANLLIVPLSSLALASNLGSLICEPWFGWAAVQFNHSGWIFMRAMIDVSRVAAGLPLGCWWVAAPSLLAIAVYYIIVFGLLMRWEVLPKRGLWALAAGAVVAMGLGWQWWAGRASADVTVLPVSGGFCVHARHPRQGPDLLVDCGRSNAVQFLITPFLHSRGVNRLDALALTHGDIRHVGGAQLLAEDFPIGKLYAGSVRFRSRAYGRILDEFAERKGCLQVVGPEEKSGYWRVLHPGREDRFSQADDGSLALLASFYGTRVLLLGDLGEAGQAALMERYKDLRADIVITGLPARGEPVCDAFIKRVHPKLIVVADSEFPASERAGRPLRERLKKTPVIYTRSTGTITLRLLKTSQVEVQNARAELIGKWRFGPQGD